MPTPISPSTPLRRKKASFDDSPLRPRQMNRLNDDVAERAARRKSAHFAADVGKENGGSAAASPRSRVVSAQARRKRLSAVAPIAPISMEVMNTNFEEWMKLATDNKITATNTWNFALIDYFHDLTLLRNTDDQSINFQKASCTLDGCVKIWTSRVDSVATETGKLLSGLAGGGDPDDENEEGEGEEGDGPAKGTRKTARSEATLAKSFAALQVKKFDLEFTVDPLFKKTKEDFDEGGAGGLLMNHLGIDGNGRVVFDAGDAVVEDDEDEDEMEDTFVDVSALREFIPTAERAEGLTISETLGAFRFASNPEDMPDLATLTGLNSFGDEREDSAPLEEVGETGNVHDFFGDEDYDAPAGYDGDNDDGEPLDLEDVSAPSAPQGRQDLFMTLVDGDDDAGMFDYFDRGMSKGWAGAEHWKLRKVARKDPVPATATKEKKATKEPFKIDFGADGEMSTKELFVRGARSTIALPARKTKKRARDEFLLPEDMHFSSRQLLRLFLKPKFALRRRATPSASQDGEIDENFWAAAAAPDVIDDDDAPAPFESQFFHDDADDDAVDLALDPAFGEDGEDDLRPGGEALRRARPDNVHYAKKAKRVDVKRLKDDIWDGLKSLVEPTPLLMADEGTESEPEAALATPVKRFDTVIQSLRGSYPKDKMSEISTSFCFICLLHLANEEGLTIESARSDGNEGVDIGLRGYADEEGQPGGMVEMEKSERVVGELQALKVFKDPTAGRAA
ncbi:hypothetical protein CcaverHIS002_0705500 [Cutaneotrichosporon cavernicola]|uniref:Condensin complex subunit 2 n=1 Tax=Cutaneotrichosporon cavernicola TaxID=279322 RepID=A0AA48LAG8_9TREE|nr:uncharacterized protein CcaverHIS019_0705540 [Cutaneotrichosporon cavernicola]BEI87204.1 hypothetical protein CcaverHIS002_0705500 [Cutaneotrichosporon cavernicola]BEI94973.1 hypothetical protein CcaverHIS019_0705540 [Cutaneotrichosporon cavernicola]BEJ02747.1 hypothetical protein CcaverHIS631_0705420 [Cutaneotrichosporon cavernicola]BEJ10500.1 hypothetical protein CcaverHIS641_0705350 [Cutaneotrichosporon cavernicola]